MDNLKSGLERKLIASVIVDKCKNAEGVIIDEALCTQERIIRFTTPTLRALFPRFEGSGFDRSGEIALYELKNDEKGLFLSCAAYVGSQKEYTANAEIGALSTLGVSFAYGKAEDAFSWFDNVICNVIPSFERNLIFDSVRNVQSEVLVEGAARSFLSTRYERNRRARAICLGYHGMSCKICGVNFERDYGKEFAEIIEVHHILPLSEIADTYVVDPINDLVPLCPNCHTAIHNKKGRHLSIDDMKNLFKK